MDFFKEQVVTFLQPNTCFVESFLISLGFSFLNLLKEWVWYVLHDSHGLFPFRNSTFASIYFIIMVVEHIYTKDMSPLCTRADRSVVCEASSSLQNEATLALPEDQSGVLRPRPVCCLPLPSEWIQTLV